MAEHRPIHPLILFLVVILGVVVGSFIYAQTSPETPPEIPKTAPDAAYYRFKTMTLKTSFFSAKNNDQQFDSLRTYGDVPLRPGVTGKNDPFNAF